PCATRTDLGMSVRASAHAGRGPWPRRTGHGRSLLGLIMSITNHNGSVTLTSLAELGSVLDPTTLPPGPSTTTETEHSPEASAVTPTLDLAGLIAPLASVCSGLE